MKIVILRHGKPSLPSWQWIKAIELRDWIDAYNRAGIQDAVPATKALDAARECSVIVTSDLARSIESAKALAKGIPTLSESLFREAGLPFCPVGNIKMSPLAWALFFRLLWAFGFEANGEPVRLFKDRSRKAADRLIELAKEQGSVLFVGHGIMNAYIARRLLSAGWTGPRGPRTHYWASAEYTCEAR